MSQLFVVKAADDEAAHEQFQVNVDQSSVDSADVVSSALVLARLQPEEVVVRHPRRLRCCLCGARHSETSPELILGGLVRVWWRRVGLQKRDGRVHEDAVLATHESSSNDVVGVHLRLLAEELKQVELLEGFWSPHEVERYSSAAVGRGRLALRCRQEDVVLLLQLKRLVERHGERIEAKK